MQIKLRNLVSNSKSGLIVAGLTLRLALAPSVVVYAAFANVFDDLIRRIAGGSEIVG